MTQETTEFEFHMSPGAELVAAPDRRRHFTEEIEQALRTGGVAASRRGLSTASGTSGTPRRASSAPSSGTGPAIAGATPARTGGDDTAVAGAFVPDRGAISLT